MESSQLHSTYSKPALPVGLVPIDADRRSGHRSFSGAGLSFGLLPFILCLREKRASVPVRDHPSLGELFGARLRVESDLGKRRRAQYSAAILPRGSASGRLPSLQP